MAEAAWLRGRGIDAIRRHAVAPESRTKASATVRLPTMPPATNKLAVDHRRRHRTGGHGKLRPEAPAVPIGVEELDHPADAVAPEPADQHQFAAEHFRGVMMAGDGTSLPAVQVVPAAGAQVEREGLQLVVAHHEESRSPSTAALTSPSGFGSDG